MTPKHKLPQRSERSLVTAAMYAHNAASHPSSRATSPTPHAGGAGPSLERGGVCSTHPRGVRLRRALVRGNLVISQRKMRQRTAVGVDSRVPALDLLNSSQAGFQVGQREARSSERWPADPLWLLILPFQGIRRAVVGMLSTAAPQLCSARKEKPHRSGAGVPTT